MSVAFETILEKRNEWVGEALQWAEAVLDKNPPEKGDTGIRRTVLEILDDIAQIESAPTLMPVQQFLQKRMEKAIREIENTSVVSGAVIWKLYNHSFVAKTAKHTFGFDIFRGASKTGNIVMSDKAIERLGNMLDILFISHRDPDHYTLELVEYLAKNGKPIIAPEKIWSDKNNLLTCMREGELEFSGMKVKVFPGHQVNLRNNVYLVEADNLSVMHTGDQSNQNESNDDFERWVDSVWQEHQVDILIVNCWLAPKSSPGDMRRFIHGVDPQIVITGHENELEYHPAKWRPRYIASYSYLKRERRPYFVMAWGEKLTYVYDTAPRHFSIQ